MIDANPWFVAVDVCRVPRNVATHLDDDEKGVCYVDTPG